MGMLDYSQLKGRLLSTTAGLVLAGSCIAFSSGGAGAAAPFAVGGSAGMAYLWLLQQSVDSLPGTLPASSASRFDKVSATLLLHCIGENLPHEQAQCCPFSSPLADVMTYIPACPAVLQHRILSLTPAQPKASAVDHRQNATHYRLQMLAQLPAGRVLRRTLAGGSVRFLFLVVASLSSIWAVQAWGSDSNESMHVVEVRPQFESASCETAPA